MGWEIRRGVEHLIPERKRYDVLGAFPRYYVELVYYEDESDERVRHFDCVDCGYEFSVKRSSYEKIRHRYTAGVVNRCYRCEVKYRKLKEYVGYRKRYY